jgi:hypothetical protein
MRWVPLLHFARERGPSCAAMETIPGKRAAKASPPAADCLITPSAGPWPLDVLRAPAEKGEGRLNSDA